jgi:hypothetical protein
VNATDPVQRSGSTRVPSATKAVGQYAHLASRSDHPDLLNRCQAKSTLNARAADPMPGPSANSPPPPCAFEPGSTPGGGGSLGSPPPGSDSTEPVTRYICGPSLRGCPSDLVQLAKSGGLEEQDGCAFLKCWDPHVVGVRVPSSGGRMSLVRTIRREMLRRDGLLAGKRRARGWCGRTVRAMRPPGSAAVEYQQRGYDPRAHRGATTGEAVLT